MVALLVVGILVLAALAAITWGAESRESYLDPREPVRPSV